MKVIILIISAALVTGCYTTDRVRYREVHATPIGTSIYSTPHPLNVTATTIDYY